MKSIKIDLKNIKLDEIKNKKELLVLCGIGIFVLAIILIGNNLVTENAEAKKTLEELEDKYIAVSSEENTPEVLNAKLFEINNDILSSQKSLLPINELEIIKILDDLQKKVGITWNEKNREISPAKEIEDIEGISKFTVKITAAAIDYEKAKLLMEYVQNLDRKVTISSLSFSKNQVTKEVRGTMVLEFYFQREVESE